MIVWQEVSKIILMQINVKRKPRKKNHTFAAFFFFFGPHFMLFRWVIFLPKVLPGERHYDFEKFRVFVLTGIWNLETLKFEWVIFLRKAFRGSDTRSLLLKALSGDRHHDLEKPRALFLVGRREFENLKVSFYAFPQDYGTFAENLTHRSTL